MDGIRFAYKLIAEQARMIINLLAVFKLSKSIAKIFI
jgi:hypothetical protein